MGCVYMNHDRTLRVARLIFIAVEADLTGFISSVWSEAKPDQNLRQNSVYDMA